MSLIVIGVDPDSKKHGVATYVDGNLTELQMLSCVELINEINHLGDMALVSIENVLAQNFVYSRNVKSSKAAHAKVALSVGRCQQAQQELMNWLDHFEIPYVLHPPQGGNWANNKPQFEKATGWEGKSNADTRSAAYFGFLALGRKR